MNRLIAWFAFYVLGGLMTFLYLGHAVYESGGKINTFEELSVLVAFAVFWPLTWLYVICMIILLLCLGWRGGPIW
jgi:hypothetical protein